MIRIWNYMHFAFNAIHITFNNLFVCILIDFESPIVLAVNKTNSKWEFFITKFVLICQWNFSLDTCFKFNHDCHFCCWFYTKHLTNIICNTCAFFICFNIRDIYFFTIFLNHFLWLFLSYYSIYLKWCNFLFPTPFNKFLWIFKVKWRLYFSILKTLNPIFLFLNVFLF